MDEAILFCEKATDLRPDLPKYAYTLAYYLKEKGDMESALKILKKLVATHPDYAQGYLLMNHIQREQEE